MRGMDYLVGVRFEASGNLYSAMGKLSLAMLGADEATKLLKNRFVDMAAAGIGMFAALTSASVQYTNTVAKLAVTLGGVKDLHKNMGFVLGAPGSAKYLSSATLGGLAGSMQSLYGGNPPRGALKTAANIANVAEYGYGYGGVKAQQLTSSLLTEGVRYAQSMGHKAPGVIEGISAGVARAVLGHQNIAGVSNLSAYYSATKSVFSSPFIGALGRNVNPNTIAAWIGASTKVGESGAVGGLIHLLAGKGMTNVQGLPLLMSKAFGFHIGTNDNVLAASMGNYLKLSMKGSKNPFLAVAQHTLLGMERMAGMTTGALITPSKLTGAQRHQLLLNAAQDFHKNSAFYGLLKTYMMGFGAYKQVPGNYAEAKKAGEQRTQRSLNLITDSAGRIFTQIGAGVHVSGLLQGTGNTLAGMASYMSKHPGVGQATGAAGLAASFSAVGAAIFGGLGRTVARLGMPTLGKALGGGMTGAGALIGRLFEGLAAFQGGYAIGSLLRGIPLFNALGKGIASVVFKVGELVPGLQNLFRALADIARLVGTFSHFHRYTSDALTNLGKFVTRPIQALFPGGGKNATTTSAIAAHTAFGGLFPMVAHGHHYTMAWGASEAMANKKKDSEQWDLDYTNPVTHKKGIQDVHIHFHGTNPQSKAGMKDVQDGIMKALRSVVSGSGIHTASPLASGNGG